MVEPEPRPDGDGVVLQVDVRMVRPGVADGRGERPDEPGADDERTSAEDRGGAVADDPPVAGAVVGVEGAHGEGFGHDHSPVLPSAWALDANSVMTSTENRPATRGPGDFFPWKAG